MWRYITLSLLLAATGFAQTGQGTIVGIVTDTTGARIPGVQVNSTNIQTRFTHNAVTNAEGIYRLPYLNPGIYEVAYESQGFKKLVRTSIQVRSTETVSVDVALELGSVVESIEVGAQATLLETETSSTGHLVTGIEVTKLPTPQMKMESMLWYVPGVVSQSGYGHAAGSRSRSFVMANDGVSALTPGTGVIGTGRNMSAAEYDVEEVKVLTTTLPAEYGHSGGGIMNVTFKSGTNQLHGVAEERYLPGKFTHRYWHDPRPSTASSSTHFISGSLNGPVVLPKIYDGRNKTFFLFGYMRHHEKGSTNINTVVPNPAMLAGDFSFGGIGDRIYDPASLVQLPNGSYSRSPFAGNQIPANRIDPVFSKFLSFDPYEGENNRNNQAYIDRTGPHDNNSADNVIRSYRTITNYKVDHSFSDRHKAFARYSNFRHRSINGRWQTNVRNKIFDFNYTPIPTDQHQFVVSDAITISPTIINEMRLGANRRKYTREPESLDQDWAGKLGIPNVSPATMPTFQTSTGGTLIFTFPGGKSVDVNENLSFQENLTIVHGRHAFKTGYELLRTRHNSAITAQPSGVYRFGGTEFPFTPNTGNAFASFMLGGVVRADFTQDLATWLPRWWSHALYFQDDWKVTPKLTLNLGLRWQYESPYNTKYGQQSQFDPNATDPLTGLRGALLHPTGPLASKDLNNLQPRVGLAYSFAKKWVFRGGFSVNTLDLWTNSLQESFDEYLGTAVIQPAPGNPDVAFYLRNGPPAFSLNVTPAGWAPYVGSNYSGRSASYYDPQMRMPYVMNWNGSLQWELASTMLVDVSYQGSAGVGLLNRWDINTLPLDVSSDPVQLETIRRSYQNFRPYPQFGSVLHYSNYGHSSFHSGTIKFEKRQSRGISFVSFYTFSKSLDEASADGSASGITFYNRRLEKGRSDFDVPHRWITYATWDLPFGRGRKWLKDAHWLVNGALGGWELNGIQTLENGVPFGFTFAGSSNVYLPGTLRPDMAPGKTYGDIKIPWDSRGPCRHIVACALPWADMNAFAYPSSFTPGQSGRNIQTSPGMIWHQLSISKSFAVKERVRASFRYDVNNPFKRYFFSPPNNAVNFRNPQTFGKITSVLGGISGQGGKLYMMAIFKLEF